MNEQKPKQVLLLDDEKLLVNILKEKLEQGGYAVTPYYTGEDALIALRSGFRPDVILFDITMPDSMSGFEFLDRVQSEKISPESVKIALTNVGQDGEIVRLMELGAAAHWMKSDLYPREIVEAVNKFFK